jgi:hypothetical protein
MLSTEKKIQLPGKNEIVQSKTQPVSIPVKRDYRHNNGNASSPLSNTPPNEFMQHLKRRIDQFATSPIFSYNARN